MSSVSATPASASTSRRTLEGNSKLSIVAHFARGGALLYTENVGRHFYFHLNRFDGSILFFVTDVDESGTRMIKYEGYVARRRDVMKAVWSRNYFVLEVRHYILHEYITYVNTVTNDDTSFLLSIISRDHRC